MMIEHCQHEQEIGAMIADIDNLITWQKTQNGSLVRMEERMNQMVTKEDFKNLADKVDSFKSQLTVGVSVIIIIDILSRWLK